MWHCDSCGAIFPAPYTMIYREDMDGEGHYEKHTVKLCPVCGEEFIKKEDEDG